MINPFDLIRETEKLYHLKTGTLTGSRRTAMISEARAVAMFMTRKLTSYSYPEIGDHFNKDHTSVIHSYKKIKKLLDSDYKNNIESVIMKLYDKFKGQIDDQLS